jgi:hypothetical protein
MAAARAAAMPASLETYLTDVVHATPAERRRLERGEPMARLMGSDVARQVIVFGAIWIDAPASRYLAVLRNIETFERGRGFRATRRLSLPPRLDDFGEVRLETEDVGHLPTCVIGDCVLKLDDRGIAAFRDHVDWRTADRHARANDVMRRLMMAQAEAYLARGNAALPVYRDKPQAVSLAEELAGVVAALPPLPRGVLDIRPGLVDRGQPRVGGPSSFLYWQEASFGLKPTLRLTHLTIHEAADHIVVTSKMIYANHYFRTALEVRTLLPDPVRGGFWFLTLNGSRTDGMTGFTGLFVRRRVRSEAREATGTVLLNTKARLEGR